MKKVLFSLAVIGVVSFASCKKTSEAVGDAADAGVEAVENTADTAVDVVDDAATDVVDAVSDVPSFDNADLQSVAEELNGKFSEMQEAATSGDQEKLTALTQSMAELAQKAQASGASQEDMTKFMEFYQSLATKAAGQ